jgi:Arc/MetJ family transcription regulator
MLKWKEKSTCVCLCFRFQLGSSFGKMKMERDRIGEFEQLVDQGVVSSGTQATMLKKLSKMALKRAQWSQKETFESFGWPIVAPTTKIGDGAVLGEEFRTVLHGVLGAYFAGTPLPDIFACLCKYTGEDTEDDAQVLKDASALLKGWTSDKTSFVSRKSGLLTDALRLKAGASTGLAVKCGVYESLGTAALQDELDFSEYARVVQQELDALLDPAGSAKLQLVSRVLRASLKMDFYDAIKVHGDIDQLGTT